MTTDLAQTPAFDPEACDKLPIHIPGLIQPHGVLFVLDSRDLTIRQASANFPKWFSSASKDIVAMSIADLLGQAATERLAEAIKRERLDNGPRFALTLPEQAGRDALDITIHSTEGQIVLEIEASERSNTSLVDPYSLIRDSITRLQASGELIKFCQTAADEMRRLTGFDRVMLYRFSEDCSGCVMAESRREDVVSFLNKRFPAGDIPKPARALFAKNWLRLVPDINYTPVPLEPAINPVTNRPLDMSYCLLRHSSQMCTTYLKNMGTASQMVMPLLHADQLWGLLVCHHQEPRYVPYAVRAACEVFAQIASLQITAIEEREQLTSQVLLTGKREILLQSSAGIDTVQSWLLENCELLASYLPSEGFAISSGAQLRQHGQTPAEADTWGIIDWLNQEHKEAQWVTDRLPLTYSSAASFADRASGLLMIRLELDVPCILVWFRQELPETVTWAGDPRKPVETGPMGEYLSPRRSFERWVETVRGRSEPWEKAVVDAAEKLRVALFERFRLRNEHSTRLEADLHIDRKELDAFVYVASHDLQEPVRGIYGYANYLINKAREKLDPEERRRLEGLIRLTDRMSDLIESLLHFSRVGRLDLTLSENRLGDIAAEALEIVAPRASAGGVEIKLHELPTVVCDRGWIREVFVNLITNAIKYNENMDKEIEIGTRPMSRQERLPVVFVKDNGIGIDEKHFGQVFKLFKRLHGKDQYGGGTGAGLALVKKIVERHGGSIWIESSIGQGSTFLFTLQAGEAS